ncbi:hypothetical protein N7466_005905 [Penicillium verhagenii]|uniref:uncharacterized protein n=1 Tax=Penicillium verhagenii TaxID=1562060 RepID=UPI0025452DC1|nr:uncharacterized protein N7466_005905 [Penicillium verhagenii]KAJ5930412.1 hypothetical protein N7466_005905 [Penicillium verhagenii]
MSSNPTEFYQERDSLVKNMNEIIPCLNDHTIPDLEYRFFSSLKSIKRRLKSLIRQEDDNMDNINKLIAERCTDYMDVVATQLLSEPVDRVTVFPELLLMIKMQIGRLRLKGAGADPGADEFDRLAERLDDKYQVRTPAVIFAGAWMYLNLYCSSTSAGTWP